MEKKFDINLSQVSKKTVDTNKRIEQQAQDFLETFHANVRKEQETKANKFNDEVMSNARFTQGSPYSRNKQRVKAMTEMIQYTGKASKIALTNVLSKLVESSLLLDTAEFAKLNPNYKTDIRETVSAFLENGSLNENITNKHTLKIMESISKAIPDIKTGVYLNEDDLTNIINSSTPEDINVSIDNLSSDVKEKVANIVSKEQEDIAAIESEINDIVAISEAAKDKKENELGATEEVVEDVQAEQVPEELEATEEVVEDVPEELEATDEVPVDEEDEYLAYQQEGGHKPKETNIEMSPDGGLRISIKEKFVRETPRKGVLETLALNEATDMIAEGKAYNADLALGNALMYITVLETFNATGLITITEQDYKNLTK